MQEKENRSSSHSIRYLISDSKLFRGNRTQKNSNAMSRGRKKIPWEGGGATTIVMKNSTDKSFIAESQNLHHRLQENIKQPLYSNFLSNHNQNELFLLLLPKAL